MVSLLAACGGDRLPARQEAAQQAPSLVDAGRLDG
jgi:hypothetical protein